MSVYLELPALLAAVAVFAWCVRKADLPKPLKVLEKLGSYGTSRENLKAHGKKLEALKVPVSAEMFSAAKVVLTVLLFLLGAFLLSARLFEGIFFIFAIPMARKLPEIFLDKLEKKRKEEILRGLPLMIDQVRIYAKAAGYYGALKMVSRATKGALGKEMAVLAAEMEIIGLIEALNNFAARCGVSGAADFARIIQVEQRTGADIDGILLNYSKMARQRKVSHIKRKIKVEPLLMTVLPGILLVIFLMMFVVPLLNTIIDQLNAIN
ncbi:MAG: type II secretion system F family protein [Bacillota bacterium]